MIRVFVGRFQPLHAGHEQILTKMVKDCTEGDQLVVVVGSSTTSGTAKNPFDFATRKLFLECFFEKINFNHYQIIGLADYFDDEKWSDALNNLLISSSTNIMLYGYQKDSSTTYLNMLAKKFKWETSFIDGIQLGFSGATELRNLLFKPNLKWNAIQLYFKDKVNTGVLDWLSAWYHTPQYEALQREWDYIQKYKSIWKNTPYPVNFVTTDVLVESHQHILLIQRKNEPGLGKYALPGGFLEQNLSLLDNAIKELMEETQFHINKDLLVSCLKKEIVADYPHRSERGRVISHVFHFNLNSYFDPREGMPPVKGGDDAAKAVWVPFSSLPQMENCFFEDHYRIIQKLILF